MGVMIDGKWHTQSIAELADGGSFKRSEASFRNWVTADGEYPAQAGRYHLYVSLACPWAHRTLIMRMLKGLQDQISVSVGRLMKATVSCLTRFFLPAICAISMRRQSPITPDG